MTMTKVAGTSKAVWQSIASLAAIAVSGAFYWLFHVRPITSSPGFSWHNFRQYFPYDQYSYLAIAVNVKNGNLAAVEPFTETGTNHYPRLYYVFLGLVSRLFDTDIVATWQVTGLAFQFVMVAAVSWLIIRLTGIPLLGIFGFLPSIVGTFAVAAGDNWHHSLDNHGVLWGSFGVLFTLNGESAALSVAVTAVCLLIGATFPRGVRTAGSQSRATGSRARLAIVVLAGAAVGLLANVQTYSFLTTVYLLLYAAGAYGLLSYGRRIHVVLSFVLLVAVLLAGNAIADSAGPLVTLMAGVLAAVPGFLLLLLRYKAAVISACLALALAASPTIIGTLLGLAEKDDFLTYRELSSNALGVPLWIGLLGALVPLLFLILIFWAGVKQQNRAWMALALGAGFAWPIAASNDLWGANQEPYRFWIDSFTIVTPAALAVLLQVAVQSWYRWRESLATSADAEPSPADAGAEPSTADAGAGAARRSSPSSLAAATAAGLVVAAALGFSFADYSKFAEYVHSYGTASFNDPQALAIKTASVPLTDEGSDLRVRIGEDGRASELVMFDPCISPFRVKALTGLPTAFYNLGLAWPSEEKKLREVLVQRGKGPFAQELAEEMNVKYVLTDTGCAAGWQGRVDGEKVSEAQYQNGATPAVITLWRIGQ